MAKITKDLIDSMSDRDILKMIENNLRRYEADSAIYSLIDESKLAQDALAAGQGKMYKKAVQKALGNDFDNVFKDENNRLRKTVRYIQALITSDQFEPVLPDPMVIKTNSNGKERIVYSAKFGDEQIIHHALIRIIKPLIMKGMYKWSCASIDHRGVYYAKKYIERFLMNDIKNTKYVLSMDIHNFFDSIPHRPLKKYLKRYIKDEVVLDMLMKIVNLTDKGLPIGFFTSNWLANFFLQPLDHYIKERILDDCGCNTKRTGRHGAVYYVRYMDDMVIFGPNKKELHKLHNRIVEVLQNELHMELKDNWQVFKFDYIDKDGKRKGRPLDFIGFKFYRDKTTIRKKTYRKIKTVINRLIRNGVDKISFKDASTMLSYHGIINSTNAKGIYVKLLKPYVRLKDLKNVVRAEEKRRRALLERNNNSSDN